MISPSRVLRLAVSPVYSLQNNVEESRNRWKDFPRLGLLNDSFTSPKMDLLKDEDRVLPMKDMMKE